MSEQNNKGNYIDRFDEFGRSLLHIAIAENAGPQVSLVIPSDPGCAPIPRVEYRCRQVIAGLISRGVDIHHTDRNGCTALFNACTNGSADDISAIMKAGAATDTLSASGQNLLHSAATGGKVPFFSTHEA